MDKYKIIFNVTVLLLILLVVPFYAYGKEIDESRLPEGCYVVPLENEFVGNYAIIQDRTGYGRSVLFGVIDTNYNLVVEPKYFQVRFDDRDKNIIYAMIKIEPYGAYGDIFIDKNGKLKKINMEMYYRNFNYKIGEDTRGPIRQFGNGEYLAVENDAFQYGVINRRGEIIIPFSLECFYDTYNGIIVRYNIIGSDDMNTPIVTDGVIINEKGEILSDVYDYIEFYDDGIIVTKNGKMNILSGSTYQEILPSWHDKAFYSNENGISYSDNGTTTYLKDTFAETTTVVATIPQFKITINGTLINNDERLYPFIVYKDITYFPMTYNDSRFLNLETHWNSDTGLQINKLDDSSVYGPDNSKGDNDTSFEVFTANFAIYVNNEIIDNTSEPYPLLVYRDVTYFPMTWRFGVDEFGWDYHFSNDEGLVINSK